VSVSYYKKRKRTPISKAIAGVAYRKMLRGKQEKKEKNKGENKKKNI
jgi:hypothetical protein